MIEKLKNIPIDMNGEPSAVWLKINELVDAINELQKHEEQHLDLLTQLNEMRLQNTKKEKLADPYVEQRKWVGKMCRFWDGEHIKFCDILGILTKINDMSHRPFEVNNGDKWEHCEPVKPDDDIIYKGE